MGTSSTETDIAEPSVDELKKKYPSMAAAQAFVVPSYQWLISRVESADTRIQAMLTFVATVTFAIPAASRALSSNLRFLSFWFILAMVLALAIFVDGLVARMRGRITLADPTVMFNKSVELSEWEFQRDALFYAGEHMDKNVALVVRKADAVTRMTIVFLIELASLFVWVARG